MGTSMGLYNTAMSIGMIVAPLISCIIMDTLGLTYIFYVAGIISLFGTFVFYHYIKTGLKR
jgi:MFS family permease